MNDKTLRKTGINGINLIKHYEGLKLKSYKCPAGVWTVGYGHTGSVHGKAICEGLQITEKDAEDLLRKDLELFEEGLNKCLTVSVNQNQFDALISFCYNLGLGNLRKSTLLKLINSNKKEVAAEQFGVWVKAGGKRLEGLVKRREEERKLFLL